MDGLLDDDNADCVGDAIDMESLSFALAQQLQREEDEKERRLKQQEMADEELARRLSGAEQQQQQPSQDNGELARRPEPPQPRVEETECGSFSLVGDVDPFHGASAPPVYDVVFLEHEEAEAASLRLAIQLAAESDEGVGPSPPMMAAQDSADEEKDVMLALKLQQEWEEEERKREMADYELAKKLSDMHPRPPSAVDDMAFAKRLAMEEEEQEEQRRRQQSVVSTSPRVMPLLPSPPHVAEDHVNPLRSSVDTLFSQHMELLAYADLKPLRNFIRSQKAVLRPIRSEKLEAAFRQKAAHYERVYGYQHSTPVVAFHGTKAQAAKGIEKDGLRMPGVGGVKVAHGSRFGKGIYTSPDISYAGRYSQGKLIVCAVLLGKPYQFTGAAGSGSGGCHEGFDSHIAAAGKEYVVFDSACCLPIFLLEYGVGLTKKAPAPAPAPAAAASSKSSGFFGFWKN